MLAGAQGQPILNNLMHRDTVAVFREIESDVSIDEHAALVESLPRTAQAAREVAGHWDFSAPSKVVDGWLASRYPSYQDSDILRLRKAIVARLCLYHFSVGDRLPPSIIDLYPGFFARLARFLSNKVTHRYKQDFYCKDIRYALGLTVPCGALQIDLRYRIGPKLVLRSMLHYKSPRAAWDYAKALSWGRWYNGHIDPREMAEFDPQGWTAAYTRIAAAIALNPAVCGIVGVSWFYDPEVTRISPAMAYPRRTQVDNGAFLLRLGPGPEHTKNALYGSMQRQELYQSGRYIPTCFLVAWPRRPLLRWAREAGHNEALRFNSAV